MTYTNYSDSFVLDQLPWNGSHTVATIFGSKINNHAAWFHRFQHLEICCQTQNLTQDAINLHIPESTSVPASRE
jgi:hypothetical protein